MISLVPAFMSAIAAGCSAYAAYKIYNIHYENRVDVVRAEVILLGWDVKESGGERFLFIESAVNAGKGPALAFGLAANTTRSTRNINFVGENVRVDLRPQSPSVSLNVSIPLHSCWRRVNGSVSGNLILRLFWTDLHEKKHLVNLLIEIDLDENPARAREEEVLMLKQTTPSIYVLKRTACWFDSRRAFKEALHKEATFGHCPKDNPFSSNAVW